MSINRREYDTPMPGGANWPNPAPKKRRPKKAIRQLIEDFTIEADAALSMADDYAKAGNYDAARKWLDAVSTRATEVFNQYQELTA